MSVRDYFSFETIRDAEKNVVCHFVTMIGTIEEGGLVRIRTDLGKEGAEKMAFGRLTIRNYDRKIQTLTQLTNTRVYNHSWDELNGAVDIVSFTAKDWRADEAYQFEVGDRVMLQGRAYIRKNDEERFPGRSDELSVTVTGLFKLGRARRQMRESLNSELIPQE